MCIWCCKCLCLFLKIKCYCISQNKINTAWLGNILCILCYALQRQWPGWCVSIFVNHDWCLLDVACRTFVSAYVNMNVLDFGSQAIQCFTNGTDLIRKASVQTYCAHVLLNKAGNKRTGLFVMLDILTQALCRELGHLTMLILNTDQFSALQMAMEQTSLERLLSKHNAPMYY